MHETFAAEVGGVDLAHPDDAALEAIARAIDDHGVVVIRGQTGVVWHERRQRSSGHR